MLNLLPVGPNARVTEPGVPKPKTKDKHFPHFMQVYLHAVQNVDGTNEKKLKSPTKCQYPEIITMKILMQCLFF